MSDRAYIGLFRTYPSGRWEVFFPDLPSCTASAVDLDGAVNSAGRALARHLASLGDAAPLPRSNAALLEAARSDWVLAERFVDAIMFLIEPCPEALLPEPGHEIAAGRAAGRLGAGEGAFLPG